MKSPGSTIVGGCQRSNPRRRELAFGIDLRLDVENQFIARQRPAQAGFQCCPFIERRLHRAVEETDGVAPGILGFVQRCRPA
jgi:hypothetical protein